MHDFGTVRGCFDRLDVPESLVDALLAERAAPDALDPLEGRWIPVITVDEAEPGA